MKISILSLVSAFSFSAAANATTSLTCDRLPGLVGEGAPEIVAEGDALYVQTSIRELLVVKRAPDLYESASFLLKFNHSWGVSNVAVLKLKGTQKSTICRAIE